MEERITKLIKLNNSIYRCTQVYADKKLEKYKLSIGTYPYLLALSKFPGMNQNEISRYLNVDKAMSARSVKKLIEYGYIKREENKEDIRANKLYITEASEAIIPDIIKILSQWIEIMVSGNSEENIEIGMDFLESVLKNAKEYRAKLCERVKKN